MGRMVWSVILLAPLVAVLTGCTGTDGAARAADGAAQTAQSPWQQTALWVEHGGQTRPFDNGTTVSVGGVNVEMFVAPYPPAREGTIDLLITDRSTGVPVEGGGLAITFDMYMPHGNIRAEALPAGGGHYLVPYKLVMPGEWRVDLTITRSDDVAALAFVFRLQ